MITPKEGDIVRYLRNGNLFKVRKVANDFVILDSLDGLSQIMTGKKGFESIFERTPPTFLFPDPSLARSLEG